jgi:hypothetical protein
MRSKWDGADWMIFWILFGTVALIASVPVVGAIGAAYNFPAELADIEQLRKDAAEVDGRASEDVIGQVTQVNRRIATLQQQNKMLLYAWAVPDGWDKVEMIPVPKEKP